MSYHAFGVTTVRIRYQREQLSPEVYNVCIQHTGVLENQWLKIESAEWRESQTESNMAHSRSGESPLRGAGLVGVQMWAWLIEACINMQPWSVRYWAQQDMIHFVTLAIPILAGTPSFQFFSQDFVIYGETTNSSCIPPLWFSSSHKTLSYLSLTILAGGIPSFHFSPKTLTTRFLISNTLNLRIHICHSNYCLVLSNILSNNWEILIACPSKSDNPAQQFFKTWYCMLIGD